MAIHRSKKLSHLRVVGRHLKFDQLVVVFFARVGDAILMVDVLGDVLCQAVAKCAQLAALSMNFPWVIAVAALPRVTFEMIE